MRAKVLFFDIVRGSASQLDAIGSLAQRQLDNTGTGRAVPGMRSRHWTRPSSRDTVGRF